MSYAVHTGAELVQQLVAQFPLAGAPAIMNDAYCAVTRPWVEKPFSRYFFNLLAARDDLKWRKRGNQCEHFALRAALEAVELFSHMDDPEIPAEAESVGVAAVKYLRADGAGWHEVNLWYLDGVWVPWEPQTMDFFTFTPNEALTVQQPIIP